MKIGQRINEVMKEVKSVMKDGKITMPNGKFYEVVTHDLVAGLLHEPMARLGIFTRLITHDFELSAREYVDQYNKPKVEYMAKAMLEISFVNSDDTSDYVIVTVPSYAFDQGDKAVAKMLSMGQKYALLKTFMLESIDNEEERQETNYAPNNYQSQSNKYQAKPTTPKANDQARDVMRYKVKVGTHFGKFLKDVPKNDLRSMIETLEPKMNTLGADWQEYINNAKEILKNDTNK